MEKDSSRRAVVFAVQCVCFFFFLLFFDMNGKENLVIKHKQCKKLTQTKIKKQNKNLITYLKSLMSNPFHEI